MQSTELLLPLVAQSQGAARSSNKSTRRTRAGLGIEKEKNQTGASVVSILETDGLVES